MLSCGLLRGPASTSRCWKLVSRSPCTGLVLRPFHSTSRNDAEITPLRKQLKEANKAARASKSVDTSKDGLSEDILSKWKLTVGIEIHAQLNTARKLFSQAPAENDTEPNSYLSSFDISLPGSQPKFQIATLIPALRAALALNCTIKEVSRFDRKHYFYHDQPAGYQVTQYYQPYAKNGSLILTKEDGLPDEDGAELLVGIKQLQMEQDTAKTQELEDGTNLIDFSRSGHPLIEIISLPHIHSPEAAAAYMRKVQAILFAVDAVTTGMELGGLRADVNVSVRHIEQTGVGHSYSGVEGLGQRTEIKNLSSFKAVEDAVKAERDRQIKILMEGGTIEGETRGWSLTNPGETRRLRGKEGEVDYRYMPDPDIAPLYISKEVIAHLKTTLPPVPESLLKLLVTKYGLSPVDARSLLALDGGDRFIYFQNVIRSTPRVVDDERIIYGKIAGNWVLHELGSLLSTSEKIWTPSLVPAESLARIITLQLANKITGTTAKRLLRIIFEGDSDSVDNIVTREGLWFHAMTDEEYGDLITKVLEENSTIVKEIREKGKQGKIMFLIGRMMKAGDRNRIEAAKAESLIRKRLLDKE